MTEQDKTKKRDNTCNLPHGPDGKVLAGPGRPKGLKTKWKMRDVDLKEAIKYVEKKKGKPFLVKLVEMAYTDKRVMIALAKKIAPDLKSTDMNLQGSEALEDLFSSLAKDNEGRRKLPSDSDD